MIYRRGNYGISVEKVQGFGKNAALWVHHNNVAIKVASFSNDKKAEMFLKYLDWLTLINRKEPEPKEENDDRNED